MIVPARLPLLTVSVLLAAVVATAGVQRPMTARFDGLSEWDFDGNGTWAMKPGGLALEKAGVPDGPIRRPGAMAIFRSPAVTDFIAEMELRSTAPVDLLVRDVLLIFGYESPTRFYYVHLAAKTDGVHNGIFLVDRADRRRIDAPPSTARLTDERWHRVRLERRGSTGAIRVFFDNDPIPMLSAIDRTIPSGRVGVGSFDETAEFRAFALRDLSATPPR